MNGKSTILYKCECGNLFDDWETYAKGTLPSYGVERKPLRKRNGRVVLHDDCVVYVKCHDCRRHVADYEKQISVKDSIMIYLKEHDFITSDKWDEVGMKSKKSFSAQMGRMMIDGFLCIHCKERPQKYFEK